MLSIQAVRDLPRLRAPGIVPCIAAASTQKFPTYSQGGATLLDLLGIYNGSKLRTGGMRMHIFNTMFIQFQFQH